MFGVELRIAHGDTGDTRLYAIPTYDPRFSYICVLTCSLRFCDTRYRIRRIELAVRERTEEERDQN